MPLHQRLPRGARWLADMRARLAAVIDPGIGTKAAHRPAPLVALDGPRQPVWAPRDYAAFAREGFMQNAIVYRSVRMIAEATASVPLLLYDRDTEVEDHPLLSLLRRPSPAATTHDLVESLVGFLLVSGNGFIEAVGVGDEVRELHVLRPDRVKVIPGPDGWPQAWEYAIDGRAIRLSGEAAPGVPRVLHMRLFHPVNDHYGMSPIEAAAAAIDLHNTAQRWNKALLDNSARPSGALVYTARDGNLTTEQYDRLKRELESGFQGALNAGRPLLLEGGLDWKSMSLTPKDLDFIEAKNAAAREIALALGVPPMLLGIPGDATYANYQEANRTFWRATVLPLATRLASQLTTWLAPAFGSQLSLRCDLDQIEALAPERDALWTRLGKADFLTLDEKRSAAGYGPAPAAPGGRLPAGESPGATQKEGGVRGSHDLKFNPAQPRVPAGSGRPSGRWTKPGSGGLGISLPGVLPSLGEAVGGGDFVDFGSGDDVPPPVELNFDPFGFEDVADGNRPDRYSPKRPGWHDYTAGPNEVCPPRWQCSTEEIVDAMSRFSVPGRAPERPVKDGESSFVSDPLTGLPAGFVVSFVTDGGLNVRNETDRLHILHDGYIERQASSDTSGGWSVSTRGIGNNVIPFANILNAWHGPNIFNEMDRRMREYLKTRDPGRKATGLDRDFDAGPALWAVDARGPSPGRPSHE